MASGQPAVPDRSEFVIQSVNLSHPDSDHHFRASPWRLSRRGSNTVSRQLARLMHGDLIYAYRNEISEFTVQLPLLVKPVAALV